LQSVGKYWIEGNYVAARQCALKIKRLDFVINWSIYVFIVILALAFSNITGINPLYLLGLSLMIPAQIGYGVYKSLFISSSRLKQQAIFEGSFSLVLSCSGIICVYLFGIPGLILAYVFASIAKNLIARMITNRWWPREGMLNQIVSDRRDEIEMESMKAGIHSVLRNTFSNVVYQSDILILNGVQGSESVAIYKVAKTLAELPVQVTTPIWSVLRPRMMKSWHTGDKLRLSKLVILPSMLMFVAFIVGLIPAWFLSDDLILMLYGKDYVTAAIPFFVLFIGTWIFRAITQWFNFWVIISEERLLGTLTYGFLFIITLSSGILYGYGSSYRMAIAMTTSMVLTTILCWFIFLRSLNSPHTVTLVSAGTD